MTETVKALRIQLLKPSTTIGVQWYSLGLALLICMGLFGVIHGSSTPYTGRTTGALAAFYLSGVGVQPWLVNQLFPFSMALSVTRRAFIQATALLVLAEAVLAGLGLAALNQIEMHTHGWFVQMRLLNLPYVHQDSYFAQALVYGVPMMALTSVTAFLGAVFRVFGQVGLWAFSVGMAFLSAVVVAILVLTHSMGHVGHFFTTQPMLADFALYPLALVVLFGGGWAVLMLRSRA
ncbi:hypothetical protein Caci_0674 [Catenulispora acidiphila DSM 44928]|uniref:Uncharacterized protein n=1 Tax=Catenulispora acidiphila (strain DSM 44928 / JCM 14897 / NBRC 102108 / NRRL B-24433 / ID139908) TaxID=479433 RepID=C7PZ54_CATAD|nr:hypothetical protein [Catenulispora acidiphila]ACU69610.1 hypothetical protein Caci_0674 [Catenulispora acidiphila DSM 44928]